jgi:hypothetical protein
MRAYIDERAGWLSGLIELAQASGEIDPALSSSAVADFCLQLAIGSVLVTPDLHAIGSAERASLLARIITTLRPAEPDVPVESAGQ